MKQIITLLVFLNCSTFLCFGMEKKGPEDNSSGFLTATQRLNREAQQADQAMDDVFDFLHLGWANNLLFKRNQVSSNSTQSTDDEQDNQQSARASIRAARNRQSTNLSTRRYQTEEERAEGLNTYIENADNLDASSKQFAWQAKKHSHSYSSLIFQILVSENARTLYGLISSGFIFCVGIKSLKNPEQSKIFGCSATLFGAAGTLSMLYNLGKE